MPEPEAGQLAILALVGWLAWPTSSFAAGAAASAWLVRRLPPGSMRPSCWALIAIACSLCGIWLPLRAAAAGARSELPHGRDPVEGAVIRAPPWAAESTGRPRATQPGVAGMQQLDPPGAQRHWAALPKYEALPTVSGGPVPMRPDGGTGFAIRLNPTATTQGQHLKTGFRTGAEFSRALLFVDIPARWHD